MDILQIETNLRQLIKSFSKESFIYDLLLAYDLPKASITRLKKGNLNLSKVTGEISWKKKLFFKEEYKDDLHLSISNLNGELKHNQRFLIVTDYNTLLAIDTKTDDKLDIPLKDLPKHYDFFLPWAGMEKALHQNENPADVKAAVKMAKLFDEIKKDNPDDSLEFLHGLNVFLSRILFCFFAEDTHIFKDNQFTNAIDSHTQTDGSDLHTYLDKLFTVLNTPKDERKNLPKYLNAFPFVNGGLFKDKLQAPKFSRSSRSATLNSGDQDWSAINPDIFGSMFQAVISVDQRGHLGQHYTSVPNIMKVIEPLFLNDLYEDFEKAKKTKNLKAKRNKLKVLLNRLYKIKIFDPACGSGNFLIIAYKELRLLEMKIFKEEGMFDFSNIHLSQFYGIEIDDFAHEIAKLALWLAEHQMNLEFFEKFGRTNPTLPLKEAGQIVQGNATRLDWEKVCPKEKDGEIYILGNPPYLGGKRLNSEQSKDMDFSGLKEMKQLDYICCWFIKGTQYIKNTRHKYSFVTTSSICQGEQVHILWNNIFFENQEIEFAYKPFPWTNNAKHNAGVICTIIGIANKGLSRKKYLYDGSRKRYVKSVSPYLFEGESILISPRSISLSNFPKMTMGSNPVDGKNLVIEKKEYEKLINDCPSSSRFTKRYMGGNDFLKNNERYCLWIGDNEIADAKTYPFILKRMNECHKYRLSAGRDAQKVADKPFRFLLQNTSK